MELWSIRIDPAVWDDLKEIEAYYRRVAPEQIAVWRQKYEETVMIIHQWPYLNEEDRPHIRHCKTAVFPYNIFYTTNESARLITITAVLHQRRAPALAIARTHGSSR